ARDAAKAERLAKTDAITRRQEAESNLARNWHVRSRNASEQDHDLLMALLFECEAAKLAPARDPRLPSYLDRVVHLAERCPSHVSNLTVGAAVERARFSPGLDRVAIVAEDRAIRLFGLGQGNALPIPAAVEKAGDAGKFTPRFDATGRRVLAATTWYVPE